MTTKTKAEKVRRTIGTQQYLFTKTAYGWGVAPAGKRGDISRVHRGYNVYTAADGLPVRCSCPSFVEGKRRCKHMAEIDKMREEQTPADPPPADLLDAEIEAGRRPAPPTPAAPRLPLVSARRFHWGRTGTPMVAEASDLGDLPVAGAESFLLESPRTGKIVRLFRYKTERDRGGEDVLADHYRPATAEDEKVAGSNFRVVIYND